MLDKALLGIQSRHEPPRPGESRTDYLIRVSGYKPGLRGLIEGPNPNSVVLNAAPVQEQQDDTQSNPWADFAQGVTGVVNRVPSIVSAERTSRADKLMNEGYGGLTQAMQAPMPEPTRILKPQDGLVMLLGGLLGKTLFRAKDNDLAQFGSGYIGAREQLAKQDDAQNMAKYGQAQQLAKMKFGRAEDEANRLYDDAKHYRGVQEEGDRDNRNFNQQKEIIGIQETNKANALKGKSDERKESYELKVMDKFIESGKFATPADRAAYIKIRDKFQAGYELSDTEKYLEDSLRSQGTQTNAKADLDMEVTRKKLEKYGIELPFIKDYLEGRKTLQKWQIDKLIADTGISQFNLDNAAPKLQYQMALQKLAFEAGGNRLNAQELKVKTDAYDAENAPTKAQLTREITDATAARKVYESDKKEADGSIKILDAQLKITKDDAVKAQIEATLGVLKKKSEDADNAAKHQAKIIQNRSNSLLKIGLNDPRVGAAAPENKRQIGGYVPFVPGGNGNMSIAPDSTLPDPSGAGSVTAQSNPKAVAAQFLKLGNGNIELAVRNLRMSQQLAKDKAAKQVIESAIKLLKPGSKNAPASNPPTTKVAPRSDTYEGRFGG